MIGAVIAAVPLLHKAAGEADSRHLAALSVFIVSMILLYAASTTYHTFNISEHVNNCLLYTSAPFQREDAAFFQAPVPAGCLPESGLFRLPPEF